MGHVAFAHWTKLVTQHGGYGECVTRQSHELDLIRFPVPMNMHNSADIAGLKSLCGKVCGQNDTVMFLDIHSLKG